MSETPAKRKADVWPKNGAILIETNVIILLAIFSLFLQYGSIEYSILYSYHSILVILGSLCVWFANRFILEKILQSRIESNKISRYLPFELMLASILVTSIIYFFAFFIFSYVKGLRFVAANFLQGFAVSTGLSLLLVLLYVGSQIWKFWWIDGEFLFQIKDKPGKETDSREFVTIENSRGIINLDLREVLYFFSESKIAFLVDTSGKKYVTQYNLSELEKALGGKYFRLNRRILVSRQVISQIKKLPNHRLLVTISHPDETHKETVSRYKSTRFKQWFNSP